MNEHGMILKNQSVRCHVATITSHTNHLYKKHAFLVES